MTKIRSGIRRRLLLTYLAIALPLLIVIVYANYSRYVEKRNDVISSRTVFAADLASNFEQFLQGVSTTERAAGYTIFQRDYSRKSASRYLAQLSTRLPVFSLDYVRTDGEIFASSDPKLVGAKLIHGKYDISSSVKYLNPKKDWFVSQLHQHNDKTTGFDIVTAVLNNNNKVVGLTVASIDASRLNEELSFTVPDGGFNITDRTGRLVYQSQYPNLSWSKRDWSSSPFIQAALSGRDYYSYGLTFPADGSYRTGVQVPIKGIGWTAGAFAKVNDVMRPIIADVRDSAIVSSIFVLLAIVLGLWMGGYIVRPLTSLAGKARTIARGSFDEEIGAINSKDEIGELAESFDTMRLSLRAYVNELHGLVEAGEKMNLALNIPFVESAVTNALQKYFDAKAVWLMLYDENEKLLKMNHFWGIEEYDMTSLSLAPGQGVAGKVLMTGRPEIIEDLKSSECDFKDIMLKAGIDSAILLPLLSGGGALGVVGLYTPLIRQHHITEKEMGLLMALANQAAVAIENARLYDDTRRSELQLKASNEDLRILNKVAIDISSGLDLAELLAKLEKNAVDLVSANVGSIGLFNNETGRLEFHHFITNSGKPLEGYDLPDDLGLADLAISLRRTVYTNDYHKDSRAQRDAIAYGLTAVLVVPMFIKDRPIGVLQIANSSSKPFMDNDIALLEALANQSAVAIENARLYQRERDIADTLQNMMLEVPQKMEGIKIGVQYHSAAEQAKVGGDFYDFIELPDKTVGIVIGDVSGKGLEAATATALAKMTVRAFAYEHRSPAEVLEHANHVLLSQVSFNQFITMIYAVIDLKTGDVSYANAGHPAPIIVDYVTGAVRQFQVGSTPLGVVEETVYENHTDQLEMAEALLLYTDGLLEARKDDEIFGEERIAKTLVGIGNPDVNMIPERLLEAAKDFAGGSIDDDVAIVVISRDSATKEIEKPVSMKTLGIIEPVPVEPVPISEPDDSLDLEDILFASEETEPEIVLEEADVSVDDLTAEVNKILTLSSDTNEEPPAKKSRATKAAPPKSASKKNTEPKKKNTGKKANSTPKDIASSDSSQKRGKGKAG